jgi:hypothetical protein
MKEDAIAAGISGLLSSPKTSSFFLLPLDSAPAFVATSAPHFFIFTDIATIFVSPGRFRFSFHDFTVRSDL